jgi:putative alpha-1,2-mannosidase
MTINAPQAADATPYVQGLQVNGKSATQAWLPESFVASGGQLDFTLSNQPSMSWGASAADAPPSFHP